MTAANGGVEVGIFDKPDNNADDSRSGAEGILRKVRLGGYDQKSALSSIKQVQDEIWQLEQALNAKNLGLKYTIPPEAEVAPLKRAKFGGFYEEDVNAYFDKLFARIRALRKQLEAEEE